MFNFVKIFAVMSMLALLSAPAAFAKLPSEVMTPYKAYRAALKKDDKAAAKENALEAWKAAEKHLGDHKSTGDLALNYASIMPSGKEKNRYKNYEKRAEAFKRAIKLSSFYGEDAPAKEVERRIALADLELTVTRHRNNRFGSSASKNKRIGNLGAISKTQQAIEDYGMQGSTFDGDLHVLYARYYQGNDNPKKAIEYSAKAIDIYKNRKDGYFTKYAYFNRLFKGGSHYALAEKNDDIDEKIKAALEFQVVMQNLEDALPATHPFVKSAFQSWMKTRSDIEEAGMLEKAEAAGLCECWPYENYKDKAVPLKRIPPRMPSSARRSGHVYVKFDVGDNGSPENISVVSSSQKMFEASAVRSVEKWRYSKRKEGIDPENYKNIPSKITYRLADRSGNIIPE